MKRISKLLCLAALLATTAAARPLPRPVPGDGPVRIVTELPQSRQEIDSVASAIIVRSLGLTPEQRKQFEPLFAQYRKVVRSLFEEPGKESAAGADRLDAATGTEAQLLHQAQQGDVSATIRIIQEYADRFAAILTADQLQQLYDTEDKLAAQIEAAANQQTIEEARQQIQEAQQQMRQAQQEAQQHVHEAQQQIHEAQQHALHTRQYIEEAQQHTRKAQQQIQQTLQHAAEGASSDPSGLTGRTASGRRTSQADILDASKFSGRTLTRDLGAAGSYTAIDAGFYTHVTISPTARTISVTANEELADLVLVANDKGTLRCTLDLKQSGYSAINHRDRIDIRIIVPESKGLESLSAHAYGQIECRTLVSPGALRLSANSYGAIRIGKPVQCRSLNLTASSYGKIVLAGGEAAEMQVNAASYGQVELGAPAVKQQLSLTAASYGEIAMTGGEAGEMQVHAASYSQVGLGAPAVKRQLNLTASSYGKIAMAGGEAGEMQVHAASYSKVGLGAAAVKQQLALTASTYGEITLDATTAAEARLSANSYGKIRGKSLTCSRLANATSGTYSKIDLGLLRGGEQVELLASSQGCIRGEISARRMKVSVLTHGKIEGSARADHAEFEANGQGSVEFDTFAGQTIQANSRSYGKITIRRNDPRGHGPIASASITVMTGGSFHAPELRTGTCEVLAASSGKATFWAAEQATLNVQQSAGPIRNLGPGRVVRNGGSERGAHNNGQSHTAGGAKAE